MRTLKEYQPLLSSLLRLMVEEVDFKSDVPLRSLLKNPRLVVIINHSTPISWLPAVCLLTEKVCRAGGGRRTPRGVIDKFFYKFALLKTLAEYISQSDHPQSFDELLSSFKESEQTDLVVFPEGALTFFGDLDQVQPFRSPRFVELAIRAKAPILLVVHQGSEDWNFPFPVPSELTTWVQMISPFFGQKLKEENKINLPIKLRKIPKYRMRLKLYSPALYEADLSENSLECKAQISEEAEKIREIMQEMFQ
jgi:hypothetical protein